MPILRPAVFVERDALLVVQAEAATMLLRRHAVPLVRRIRELGYAAVAVAHDPGALPQEAFRRQAAVERELTRSGVTLTAFVVCPHAPPGAGDPDAACRCRPPAPGLLLDSASRWGIDLRRSLLLARTPAWFGAGRRAGVRTVGVGMVGGGGGAADAGQPAPDRAAVDPMRALALIQRVRDAELER